MKPQVGIVMGSTSDWPVMEKAAKFLDSMEIAFEVHALSAHRTPDQVKEFALTAPERGIKVIIAGAGGAAHLPGFMAAFSYLPVIGVPCRSSISLDGWDSVLSIVQMPPGIPVATVGLDGAENAAILAAQILSVADPAICEKIKAYKKGLAGKVVKANEELSAHKFKFRV